MCGYIRRLQHSVLPQVYNCYIVCSLLSLYEYECGKHKVLPSLITPIIGGLVKKKKNLTKKRLELH